MPAETRRFDPRPLMVVLLIPIVAFGYSIAHYAMRSVIVLYFVQEAGWTDDEAFGVYGGAVWATVVGVLIAAGVGAALGGWGALVAGLGCMTVGIAGMALLGDPTVPFYLESVGRGMAGVGFLVVLADAFRGDRNWLLAAGFALFYGGVNAAAILAPSIGSGVGSSQGFAAVFGIAATVGAISTVVVLGAGIAWHLLARRYPEPDPRRGRLSGTATLLAIGAAALAFPALVLHYQALDVTWSLTYALQQAQVPSAELLVNVNPVAVVIVTTAVALVAGVMHSLRVPPRPLAIAAIGAIMVGLGLALAVGLGWPATPAAVAPLAGALVIGAIGEVFLETFLVAGWARDLHWRLLPVLAGGWRVLLIATPAVIATVLPQGAIESTAGAAITAGVVLPGLVLLAVALAIAAFALARQWRLPAE